jgi:hypothetical protein
MSLNRKLGWLVVAVILFGATETQAITCGSIDCADAGPTNDSPFNVGDSGDFASSVDVITPSSDGDSFAHAWSFTLNEAARIDGTLTNNNTRPTFDIDGLSLQLFSTDDLSSAIGGTFTVTTAGFNPFVNFGYANLTAGDYIFKVAGIVDGSDGQYASQFGVSEVPLPPAIWLLVSAILGLTSIARVRRGARAAEAG